MDKKLLKHIIEGIEEKKGNNIVTLNLKKINNSICDYFVICHGDSTTQVNAIVDSIKKTVSEQTKTHASHTEGFENSQWIIIDYFTIIVHVFQKQTRELYNIEDLWADAKIEKIKSA